MAQQGPPPSQPGRFSRPRHSRHDEDYGGEEEYPPWAGMGIVPRYADHDERERRRLGDARLAASHRAADGAPSTQRAEAPAAGWEAGEKPPTPAGRHGSGTWERPERPGGGPGRPRRPGSRSGERVARLRRSRQLLWTCVAAVVVIVVAAVAASQMLGGPPAAKAGPDGLVTTYQPGELKTVPNACSAVGVATLSRYLPGHRRVVVPRSLFGRAQSLCNWSVDAPPMYRLLEVTVQAYAPSGLASGNGSATDAAIDAYRQAMAAKARPAKQTHLPKAAITAMRGLGDAAFLGVQVPSAGGAVTDLVTVVARQRNVLLTVVLEGLTTKDRRYGPVSVAQLRAGAVAATRDVLSHLS